MGIVRVHGLWALRAGMPTDAADRDQHEERFRFRKYLTVPPSTRKENHTTP